MSIKKKALNDLTQHRFTVPVIDASVNLTYGQCFSYVTDYQDSFANAVRKYIETQIFVEWEGCNGAGADGKVIYHDVETDVFGIFERFSHLSVDYYAGEIKCHERKLSVKLEVILNATKIPYKEG